MAKKSTLPIEVHDHFRKANLLHTYVQQNLGEATKHALQTGQELLAAKKGVPHGGWESECERLFDGSLRTARFYMQFAKDFSKLKTAEASAVLLLEGTLEGAAKAAKQAARSESPSTKPPPPEEPPEPPPINGANEKAKMDHPDGEERGTPCPNCLENGRSVDWWDDEACGFCRHPFEASQPDKPKPPGKPKPPAKQLTKAEQDALFAREQIKVWADTVKRWLSNHWSIDELREKFPGRQGDKVVGLARDLSEALKVWQKVIK